MSSCGRPDCLLADPHIHGTAAGESTIAGGWTPEAMAAHKARLEFMEAMGQAHYSRTDAQWHVARFAKTVGAELEAEVSALKLQVSEYRKKGEDLCQAYGNLLLNVRQMLSEIDAVGSPSLWIVERVRASLEPVAQKQIHRSDEKDHAQGICDEKTCLYCEAYRKQEQSDKRKDESCICPAVNGEIHTPACPANKWTR